MIVGVAPDAPLGVLLSREKDHLKVGDQPGRPRHDITALSPSLFSTWTLAGS